MFGGKGIWADGELEPNEELHFKQNDCSAVGVNSGFGGCNKKQDDFSGRRIGRQDDVSTACQIRNRSVGGGCIQLKKI